MIICPVCGEANGDSSLYCQSCAARLNVGAGSAVPEHKLNSSYTQRHNVGAAPSFYSGNSSEVSGPSVKNVQSLFSRYNAGDAYNTRYADILHVFAIVLLAINIVAGVLSFFLTLDDTPVLSFILLVSLGLSAAISYFSLELFSSMYRNIALTGRNTEVLCYAIQPQTDILREHSGILGGIAQSQNAMTEALRSEISAINVSADVAACTHALEQLPQRMAQILAPMIAESISAVASGIPEAVRASVQEQLASISAEAEAAAAAAAEAAVREALASAAAAEEEAEPQSAPCKVTVRQAGQSSGNAARQVSVQQSRRNDQSSAPEPDQADEDVCDLIVILPDGPDDPTPDFATQSGDPSLQRV